jgi:hypothetical protein
MRITLPSKEEIEDATVWLSVDEACDLRKWLDRYFDKGLPDGSHLHLGTGERS